jgi:DNA repair exonuclease SbcCD ATPase subunit
MKTSYLTILVLAAVAAAVLPCRAAEDINKGEDSIWSEYAARGRFELTDEKIERILNRLAETDPEKTEELKKLRAEDPEKFKTELREVMREQFGKKRRERMKERLESLGPGMPPNPCNVPGPKGMHMQKHGEPFGPGHIMPEMGMGWKYDKYLDWLKENYPYVEKQLEEAKKLAEQSKNDADRWREYWKQFGLSLKKYGRIAEAARENPQLAEVLKKDLALRQQQDKLLEEIETATDEEKEELVKELKEVVNSRFDVIVERKQIEYEQLLNRLERLKNEVEKRKAKIEKWKDTKFKDESVNTRLEELLTKSDKFTWQ